MQTLTCTRTTRAEVEMICVQLALAALQHQHCFGRPAIIQYAHLTGFLDETSLEKIIHGAEEVVLVGSVMSNLQRSHKFSLVCRLKPLELGNEMYLDLRLNDGHTVVCGHAVLVDTEDGGIKFEVQT